MKRCNAFGTLAALSFSLLAIVPSLAEQPNADQGPKPETEMMGPGMGPGMMGQEMMGPGMMGQGMGRGGMMGMMGGGGCPMMGMMMGAPSAFRGAHRIHQSRACDYGCPEECLGRLRHRTPQEPRKHADDAQHDDERLVAGHSR